MADAADFPAAKSAMGFSPVGGPAIFKTVRNIFYFAAPFTPLLSFCGFFTRSPLADNAYQPGFVFNDK
jgi:hypothetical protein